MKIIKTLPGIGLSLAIAVLALWLESLLPVHVIGASVVASLFPISASVVAGTKTISKFLMVSSLGAIGLNTSFSSMKKSGIRPMIHGFVISALVVVVALVVEIAMGIV